MLCFIYYYVFTIFFFFWNTIKSFIRKKQQTSGIQELYYMNISAKLDDKE